MFVYRDPSTAHVFYMRLSEATSQTTVSQVSVQDDAAAATQLEDEPPNITAAATAAAAARSEAVPVRMPGTEPAPSKADQSGRRGLDLKPSAGASSVSADVPIEPDPVSTVTAPSVSHTAHSGISASAGGSGNVSGNAGGTGGRVGILELTVWGVHEVGDEHPISLELCRILRSNVWNVS